MSPCRACVEQLSLALSRQRWAIFINTIWRKLDIRYDGEAIINRRRNEFNTRFNRTKESEKKRDNSFNKVEAEANFAASLGAFIFANKHVSKYYIELLFYRITLKLYQNYIVIFAFLDHKIFTELYKRGTL